MVCLTVTSYSSIFPIAWLFSFKSGLNISVLSRNSGGKPSTTDHCERQCGCDLPGVVVNAEYLHSCVLHFHWSLLLVHAGGHGPTESHSPNFLSLLSLKPCRAVRLLCFTSTRSLPGYVPSSSTVDSPLPSILLQL